MVNLKWYQIQEANYISFALACLLISSFGATIITSWELDKTSKLSTWLHYIGALCAFATAPFAFAIYQQWSALSVTIMLTTYILLIIFGSLYSCVSEKYIDNPQMVHRVSLLCITIELVAVVLGELCVILFIYCLEDDRVL